MKRVAWVMGAWLCLVTGARGTAAEGDPPCFVAFIHGSGDDLHDEGPDSARVESYWTPDGTPQSSFTHQAGRQWDTSGGACAIWRVGYDGNQAWWSDRAAGRVARSLRDFIDQYAIPDGRLVLIGHSMGGLVARYVVNNGTPGAPYFNEYKALDERMDYELVRRKTAYLITVQAPHAGSQGADALYGSADHTFTNTSAGVIKLLGWRALTQATAVMTRPYLEAAGAPGGEMGDEGRAVPMYTIAGVSTDGGAGTGMEADGKLDLAWTFLCYKSAARNSWGAGCRWDFWNFAATAGDGLVERASAHGLWLRKSANGLPGVGGARAAWLDLTHNHNQGRFDALAAPITDLRAGWKTQAYPGSYVGSFGLALPTAP
jgi:hypothetical protein